MGEQHDQQGTCSPSLGEIRGRGWVKQCFEEKWVASTGLAGACACEDGQGRVEDEGKRNVENNFSEI